MLRRHWKAVVLVLLMAGIAAATAGCLWWRHGGPPPVSTRIEPSKERSRRLLALAAREAAQIPEIDVRLTRLLNLADQQIQHGWKGDAPATLTATAQTLRSNEAATALGEHARLSGWISISELSRQCGDTASALAACDGAMAAMQAIEDPGRRCDYVIGICNELQYLRGKPAAAKTIDGAGPWTISIDNVARRRQAVVGFASALFNLDDYDAGERMIQREQDAAWRSQTLASLAGLAAWESAPTFAMARAVSAARAPDAPLEASDKGMPASFGKQLNYAVVFQNQVRPQTPAEAQPGKQPVR